MSKEHCIKCVEDLEEIMCRTPFPLNLRDKIIEDIVKYFGYTEKELAETSLEMKGLISSTKTSTEKRK